MDTMNPAPLSFYMVDVDLVREWDGDRMSVTFYDEDWDVDDLLRAGYEVVGTYVW